RDEALFELGAIFAVGADEVALRGDGEALVEAFGELEREDGVEVVIGRVRVVLKIGQPEPAFKIKIGGNRRREGICKLLERAHRRTIFGGGGRAAAPNQCERASKKQCLAKVHVSLVSVQ